MSRRSSNRKRCAKLGKLRASEELGLNSFVKENMSECKEALGLTSRLSSQEVVIKLREVMGLSDLSVEELLARFISKEALSQYCEKKLGKSGKGTSPVLASRIAREWVKPSFDPNKVITAKTKTKSTRPKTKTNSKEQKKLQELRKQALETPFEDDGTKLKIRFRGRDVSAKTIQVPSQAPLKYLVALIAKETKSRGPIDLLSGFPPRSLSLKVTSEKAPISNFLRTNEMITIASKASSSSSKKKPEKRKRVPKNTTSTTSKRKRVTTTNSTTTSEDGVMLLKKLSQKRMESHLEMIRGNKRLRSAFGKQWKITENQNVRRVQDGQFSEMIVHFKFGQRKWEKEKVTKMKEDELRAVIRHVLLNLGDDAKEQLRLANLAQVSPRVFWNLCIWDQNNPAPSLSAVASLEYSITRLLPDEDWSFLKSRKRKLSAKAARNQKRNVTEKEMRKAAKLVADVASSKEVKIVWSKEGPYVGTRVRRYFSQGPVDGTVVMYAKPQKGDDVALWRISHDDGDEEDLEEQELRLAIDVMKKWKSSGHPYIGRKVLRVFGGGDVRVSGVVTEFFDTESSSEMLWHVVHEDGDEEDLSRDQVELAIQLEEEERQKQQRKQMNESSVLSSVIVEREIVNFLGEKLNTRTFEDLAQANAFELRQHIRQGLRLRVTEDGMQEYIDRAHILASNSIMRNILDTSSSLQSFRRVSGIRYPVELSRCVPEELHRKIGGSLDSVRSWIAAARDVVEKKSWLRRPPP